jgi:hypothetical protein
VNVDELAHVVTEHFKAEAAGHGLVAADVRCEYRLNWGGFVCAGFTVTDGRSAFHVKLAPDEWTRSRIRRWMSVHELLSARHHAPRVLGWVDVAGWGGPILEHIDGAAASWRDTALMDELAPAVHRLHDDADLAEAIGTEGRTLRDSFLDYYIAICRSDLEELPEIPPFVTVSRDWMLEETMGLEKIVRARATFEMPATRPAHGDLWPGNILVRADRTWSIIDWDDLDLGDPAFDWGVLLYSPVDAGADPGRWLGALAGDAAFMERFDLCIRGMHLLNVVDSLADWWDADLAPAHAGEMRAEKESVHRWALGRYRELYQ